MRFRSSGSWSGSASRTAIPARIGGPPRTVAGPPARIIGLGPTRRRAGAAVAVIRPLQRAQVLASWRLAAGWQNGRSPETEPDGRRIRSAEHAPDRDGQGGARAARVARRVRRPLPG